MDSYTFRVQRERERVMAGWGPTPSRRLGLDIAEHVCGFLALPGRETPDDVLRECFDVVREGDLYESLVHGRAGTGVDRAAVVLVCVYFEANHPSARRAIKDYVQVTRLGVRSGSYTDELGVRSGSYTDELDARMALALGERPEVVRRSVFVWQSSGLDLLMQQAIAGADKRFMR